LRKTQLTCQHIQTGFSPRSHRLVTFGLQRSHDHERLKIFGALAKGRKAEESGQSYQLRELCTADFGEYLGEGQVKISSSKPNMPDQLMFDVLE